MSDKKQLIKSFTRKDFEIQWFSGSGGGGQNRNKHANCCRIIHIESGLTSQSTEHKERPANQKAAFKRLADMVVAHYFPKKTIQREKTKDKIRTYHAVRNQVKDHASGFTQTFDHVVGDAHLEDMVDARRKAIFEDTND